MLRHQKDPLRPPRAEELVDADHLARAQGRPAVRSSIRDRLNGVHDWRNACQVTR
jgi:hypothetical protein